ncbi:MAG: hypothetical protein ACR2PX_27535 [Endozoicomonas sp.]|uniref:hypothetical protein n=1 Tax=Endozoicomonas sp. TaxID=1892382 RepID=UPI003D9B2D04
MVIIRAFTCQRMSYAVRLKVAIANRMKDVVLINNDKQANVVCMVITMRLPIINGLSGI